MTVRSNGALFKNNTRTNDKAPEYRGNFTLTKELLDALCNAFDRANGGECKVELAAWVKDGQKGKYFSLSVSPPYEGNPQNRSPSSSNRPQTRQMDDPIPF